MSEMLNGNPCVSYRKHTLCFVHDFCVTLKRTKESFKALLEMYIKNKVLFALAVLKINK